jgi:hypothetical protein
VEPQSVDQASFCSDPDSIDENHLFPRDDKDNFGITHMTEIIRFPSAFRTWDQTESIVRKNLEGLIQKKDEDYIVSRFKEAFQKLPLRIQEVSIELKGTGKLRPGDLEILHAAIQSAMDQMLEQVQVFTGHVLGEIFALVFDLWKCETKLDDTTSGARSNDN